MNDLGLIPPHDIELEKAVLGALVIEKSCHVDVTPIINEGCFYKSSHQLIYQAFSKLYAKGEEIDLLTMVNELDRTGELEEVGGPTYLVELTQKVASGAHAEKHAKILYELSCYRSLISIGQEMVKNAYAKTDLEGMVGGAQNSLLKLFHFEQSNVRTITSIVEEVFKVMERNHEQNGRLSGIGTGLMEFDSHSGGLQRSDLVIIAAETSQGKTSLALTMAKNASVLYGAKVAFYSLEMSNTQLVGRLMAQEAGVSGKSILTQKLDRGLIQMISDRVSKLESANIYFDDSSTTRLDSILRSIRSMKVKFGVDLVVVDYLQLVGSSEKGSREQHVADVARSLKNIAKELDICVIALSQLKRSDNPKPTINRLRDSGQIEEAADVILLVYRPEFYGLTYDKQFEEYSPHNSALVSVAKGRNIGTKDFILSFRPEQTKFSDYVHDPTYSTPEREF